MLERMGTEWTEPGQGDTLLTIQHPLKRYFWRRFRGGKSSPEARKAFHDFSDAVEARVQDELDAVPLLPGQTLEMDGPLAWQVPTNLRLTGAPLTKYDLERIAQCKVSK